MEMNGNHRRKAGFSLIEVVIAMAVLSVGLLGFISLYGSGYKALQVSSKRTIAVRLAHEKMETLRQTRPVLTPSKSDTPPEAGLTRIWSIMKSNKNEHIWIISVEVNWTNQDGQVKKVVLKSFRSI